VTYRRYQGGDVLIVASVPSEAEALVIRIWREPGVPGFRGRILSTTDAGDPGVVVRNSEQVHAVVQEWLDRFLADPPEHGRDELR
jgi:hypothetical protein